jgi:chromosome segregation ATPase
MFPFCTRNTVRKLKNEIETLKQSLTQSENKINKLSIFEKEYNNLKKEHLKQIEEYNKLLDKTKQIDETYLNKIKQLREINTQTNTHLKNDNKNLNEYITELQEKHDILKQSNSEIENKYKNLKTKTNQYLSKIDDLKEELNKMNDIHSYEDKSDNNDYEDEIHYVKLKKRTITKKKNIFYSEFYDKLSDTLKEIKRISYDTNEVDEHIYLFTNFTFTKLNELTGYKNNIYLAKKLKFVKYILTTTVNFYIDELSKPKIIEYIYAYVEDIIDEILIV